MLQIGQIYEVDGERFIVTDVISTVGGSMEYRLKSAQEFLNAISSPAVSAEISVLPPGQEAAISYATPTDTDGDDATFVWDPPRVNGTPSTQYPDWRAYPDRSGIDGTFVGRRLQIQPVDDPPELDLETTSVSRPDDGNVVLEGFRPLHPQIPTGDTYRIVQPNINIASPATTNIFSDNIVADSADSRWIDDQMAKYIEEVKKELNNILNKPAAEPIDNDAWDELFTPAT